MAKTPAAAAPTKTETKQVPVELPPPPEYVQKSVMPGSELSIHRRMLLVYEWATHVMKNDKVEMTSERSYSAVTHDDISAILHLPLARAGILYKYDQTSLTVTEFETTKPGWKPNDPPKVTKWYRADVEVTVKFINADKPDDFLEYTGKAYAIDSSDKAPAKATSLALKVIDLKAFKLESRDHEEQREFERRTQDDGPPGGWDQRQPQDRPAQPARPPAAKPGATPAKPPAQMAAKPPPPPPPPEELPTTDGLSEPPDKTDPTDKIPEDRPSQAAPATKNPEDAGKASDKALKATLENLWDFGKSCGLDKAGMNELVKHRTGKIDWPQLTNFEVKALRNTFADKKVAQ